MRKLRVVLLGPLPPPAMGPTLATEILLGSRLAEEYEIFHLDTSDHRGLETLGTVDFRNVFLAFAHYLGLFLKTLRRWPALVYIPVSQTTLGYFRDAGFILIAKLFGRKVVCHLRGGNFRNWYEGASPVTRWLVRRIHGLVDGQIVLGESLRPLFEGILPDERVFVVPNGKDTGAGPEGRRGKGKVVALFLSNMHREKGIMEFLEAAALVAAEDGRVEFVAAGAARKRDVEDEMTEWLRRHASLPVRLAGAVSGRDKEELYREADIFVLPSFYPAEGLPWVVIEAMAWALPVISTGQGAIPETVRDGENGFIVARRSSEKIAEKIKLLAGDGKMRAAMGRASRRIYLERFTEKKMVDSLGKVFARVLEQ